MTTSNATPTQPAVSEEPRREIDLQRVCTLIHAMWPGVFAPPYRPLQRKIHRPMLQEAQTNGCDLQEHEIKAFLAQHCTSPEYRHAVANGGPRFDLHLAVRGHVSPGEQASAKLLLAQADAAPMGG